MSDPGPEGKDAVREPEADERAAGSVAELEERPTRPFDAGGAASEADGAVPAEATDDNDADQSGPQAAAVQLTISVAGCTDVGLVRDHNEDNYLVADLTTGDREPEHIREVGSAGCVLAVCDGMGGAAAGEVASQMAVDTILTAMSEATPVEDRDGFAHTLVRAVELAGARIFEAASDDRTRRGMGTTATVAALMDKTLFVGQVGDSRAYVLRNGELKLLTKDQSLVNQLIEAGQLTEDEAEAFEHSNIILQALGTTDQVSVDLTFLELRQGDRIMLCSDGLSGLVHSDVIRDVMAEYDDLRACCDRLIELAKAGGGHDNVTVIVAEFGGPALVQPSDSDVAGYQQYPLPLAAGADTGASGEDGAGAAGFEASSMGYATADGLDGDGSGSARYLAVALVLLAIAFAVYYWTGGGGARGSDTAAVASAAGEQTSVEPAKPEPVEVVVRTDVAGSELHVDGASYGAPEGDRWMLDLPPGPHRLEARAGGNVVASSLVTLREGIPATVFLSMPEVNDEQDAAVDHEAEAEQAQLSPEEERRRSRKRAREERRRKRREARREQQASDDEAVTPKPKPKPKSEPSPPSPTQPSEAPGQL